MRPRKNTRIINLIIHYQNTRGLRTKLKKFLTSSACFHGDIICVSETWLNSSIQDGEVIDNIYNLFRKDRDHNTSERKRGGGVLIAIKKNIAAELIETDNDNIEQIFVKVKCKVGVVIIGCVYIPPLSSLDIYNSHINTISYLQEKYDKCKMIIIGDYNLPSSHPLTNCENLLYSRMILHNCQQYNIIKNKNDNMLDLCFSSTDIRVKKAEPLTNEDKYHPALKIKLDIQINLKQNNTPSYSFRNADYQGLNGFFLSTNWVQLYMIDTIEDKINWFYNLVNEGIAQYVPIYSKRNSKYPYWFSNELINKIKEKNEAHSKYKKFKSRHFYETFRNLRNVCKKLNNECYDTYLTKTEVKIKTDATKFWGYIKNKRRNEADIPSTMNWNGTTASNGKAVSNLFASFFKSIYNVDVNDFSCPANPNENNNQDMDLSELHVTYDDVYKQLRKLNHRKGAGPDGIPNILLKKCAAGLAEPITHLFDVSLRSGVFPAAWKMSFISPIHKAGTRCDVTNYRPICIQSAIAKLLEKIVLPQINAASYNIISTKQHGFVGGRSTSTNLYIYTGYVLDAMNEGLTTHTIYTDFSKAFDMVDHEILINKLDQYNIKNKALEWLKSYLTDRQLQVRVNGHFSESYRVISGVPQGSHLGPTLFNIFINDIGKQFKSEYLLYADDLKIFRKINSEEDIDILQHDIDTLHRWCVLNKLTLNNNKCVVLSLSRASNQHQAIYYLNNELLTEESLVKDLGIIMDSKLNFIKHVDKITSHAYKILGFIIRSGREFKDPNTLIHLFKTLVRPILEYCSIIWSPYTQGLVDEVERIQRKFCKFVSYFMYTKGVHLSTEEVYRHFKLDSLKNRRTVVDLIFFYKVINGQIQSPEIRNQYELIKPRSGLRSTRLLNSAITSKNYVYHGPKNRITNLVNKYNSEIDFFMDSVSRFTSKVKELKLTN